ncbi:SPFH domain-containing protein [Candidatus Bodocaedibacter vickermanii]|uniref:Modulator of FtsH protease HflK n=1 Tax=Candidatus Bodocaedibacter vickermanii TaxID=2741701 RepID=A0A7L9RT15_9PROT|nr:Modulator of FtsH protease HflK [Candidatus Paracaedibacteraceae bacterium 'Lake Konstanz']
MEFFIVGFVAVGVLVLILVLSSLFIVDQQSAAIIERFGRFLRISQAGLNIKIPFVDRIQGRVTLRLKQLDVAVETKTLDNVFVDIVASVQYRVLPDKVYKAFYILDNADAQIQAYVFDVIRARVPLINLDDVFSKKDEIANSVKEELQEVMNDFGYDIIKALVTDINPDNRVKTAMNEINEAQRLRVAAMERGEAEKILKVKQAEAESESKILQGKGIAGQRRAIMEGLKESLGEFQRQIGDSSPRDAMTLIMMSQYFDTLKDLGLHSNQNTILIPHSPSSMNDLFDQMRNAIITGNQAVEKPTKSTKVKAD